MTTSTATLARPGTVAPGTTAPETTVLEIAHEGAWVPVCRLAELVPGRGAAVLLPDGRQAAVFVDRHGRAYAVGNQDPFTGAWVLSRGLLGSTGNEDRPFVASPLLKQRFDLVTGACLDAPDDPSLALPVYPVRTR
ncbi:nitrite reductase (NAD(P)H) small subunit [Streptomyces sp. 3MP-14]|uniref:Nitrite reductase (NAD(P)H) small subunit n=1 Tax=Streptomyces mimosae TaxID=2586635 RepID=A0A5N6ASU4_9ACTN|nr:MULTISPECIES: nitrite reductase (NAD(P)H) small subunit [Streptomyces]KAB8170990.1 nitrite reductase (NAD(P)H) small subunit [Streptomyces mimosae]KAB8179659.1 nitrite reductase (NAD(P)H) small subunit [Streptomyces sp. 3MP-14]